MERRVRSMAGPLPCGRRLAPYGASSPKGDLWLDPRGSLGPLTFALALARGNTRPLFWSFVDTWAGNSLSADALAARRRPREFVHSVFVSHWGPPMCGTL